MKIIADNLGKRFNREWIFKHFSFTLETGNTYAITGPNGSGKSTLSQVLWGQVPPTVGTLKFYDNERVVDEAFRHVSIAAPYMDLIEEFTLEESIRFHFKFKTPTLPIDTMIEAMELASSKDKKIGLFSSGMKQRLKLALAFYSQTPFLFLDEPTTNLDSHAIAWYHNNLARQSGRGVIIASNKEDEYPPNAVKIDLSAYKGVTKQPR